ncbi:MAG: hypothetical protein RL122_1655 [Pseudomonadota bacterium]|uniref:Uncharacterized protein n=1 Tax=Thiothrix fructosivorans TaxID=111770 RepID=A0A8B0SN34_9GAMM|nr:hypothetical protein [Thiothrix fructosivorans]MBO0612577.1 hypothetical protein [Thiothrix fructosivorans]QTX11950.1 hypothetical protein J1836_006335 [Thiothrix fructosivorans]
MTDTPPPADDPAPPPPLSIGKRLQAWVLHSLDFMRLLTERLMGFLRLFATLGLFLMVLFVVVKAVDSANLVLVKAFTVPQSMSASHTDAGRIIANALKQELLLAENDIYATVKRTSRNGKVNIEAVTGNNEDYLLGSSIKLPETGISINDVVEFIGSIFGRRNITGSVYQDQGKLFLQVELDGRIFHFERKLDDHDPKALNMDLIRDMLRESRTQLLSVASESHNLYFYCTGEAASLEHPDSQLSEWFDYCSRLQSSQVTPETLETLLRDLHSAHARQLANGNDTLRHILAQTIGSALDKTRLLCPDYPTTKVCKAPTLPEVAQMSLKLPEPMIAAAAPSLYPELPDARAFEPETLSMRSMIRVEPMTYDVVEPLVELPSVRALQAQCASHAAAKPQEILASNRTESDATLLFNNNRPIQAVEKYAQAIEQNCGNVFAWANLGVLLVSTEPPLRSVDEAQLALEMAVKLNDKIDWIQNNLCIARAWLAPLESVEKMISDEACTTARGLNPANKVILDKQFYLAVADRYLVEGQYAQAASTYQIAVSADRKRDCNTSKVIDKLALLEAEHGVAGAKAAACTILQDAVALPGGKISACEAKLAAFQCP